MDSNYEKERPWTTEEIRKNCCNWNLAGDVGLYNLLVEFSQSIISRTHEVENAVDSLIHKTQMANAKVNNVINDFHMLSNIQFVENRVYDEEIQGITPEVKPSKKTKEEKEAEMLPKIIKAVELGLQVLDQAFTKIDVDEMSDSDDEDLSSGAHTILEPKDPYRNRILPYIIGSDEFHNCDCAGLQHLLEDVEDSAEIESSLSDSVDMSSDEESDSVDFNQEKLESPEESMHARSESEKLSSSDESELFGSEKESKKSVSLEGKRKDEFLQEIESKLGVKESKPVPTPQPKTQLPQDVGITKSVNKKEKEDEDLFTQDMSDDESPFRKKTGLFTSEITFDDDVDDFDNDLFGKTAPVAKKEAPKQVQKPTSTVVEKPKRKEEPSLFESDDEGYDIFSTILSSNAPSKKKTVDTKPELSAKTDQPTSLPAPKKVFGFEKGKEKSNSLFEDESDGEDLFSEKPTRKSSDVKSSEDIFSVMSEKSSFKSEVSENEKAPEKNVSLFDEKSSIDKSLKKFGTPLPGMVSSKTKDIFSQSNKEKSVDRPDTAKLPKETKKTPSLFDDDDDQDDIFNTITKKEVSVPSVKKLAGNSLFEDSDDFDLFSSKPKQPALFSSNQNPVLIEKSGQDLKTTTKKSDFFEEEESESTPKKVDLFAQDSKTTPKKSANAGQDSNTTPKKSDLFAQDFKTTPEKSDLFEQDSKTTPKKSANTVQDSNTTPKKSDLFEQDFKTTPEKSDLFEQDSKDPPKKSANTVQDSKTTPKKSDLFAQDFKTTHKKSPTMVETPGSPNKVSSGFDNPADSTKTLHALNKDRAKISIKRRPPTKKGRMAAMAHNEEDAPNNDLTAKTTDEPPVISPTPVLHKEQEKKKMNLMSQLMSEAATSSILRKTPTEEVVDLFADVDKKERSSSGFSFLSPVEGKKTTKDVLVSDDEDDLFGKPFENLKSKVSLNESVLNLDDDEDDLFSTLGTANPKSLLDSAESDIFAEDSDIFSDLHKDKYEMFPSQSFENEGDDDDIFNTSQPSGSTPSTVKPAAVKDVEKKPVFDDPLSSLLSSD